MLSIFYQGSKEPGSGVSNTRGGTRHPAPGCETKPRDAQRVSRWGDGSRRLPCLSFLRSHRNEAQMEVAKEN